MPGTLLGISWKNQTSIILCRCVCADPSCIDRQVASVVILPSTRWAYRAATFTASKVAQEQTSEHPSFCVSSIHRSRNQEVSALENCVVRAFMMNPTVRPLYSFRRTSIHPQNSFALCHASCFGNLTLGGSNFRGCCRASCSYFFKGALRCCETWRNHQAIRRRFG